MSPVPPADGDLYTLIGDLYTLIGDLGVIRASRSETLYVPPHFRSRGQSFARYHRVHTKSQLSSASSGVGFSHEFEDLDYPLSRTGSFAQPTMSPVPPADGDLYTLIGDLYTLIGDLGVIRASRSETLYVPPHFRSRGQSFARYHRVHTKSQLSIASSGEFEDLDYPLSKPAGSLAQPMLPVPPDGDQTSIERNTGIEPPL